MLYEAVLVVQPLHCAALQSSALLAVVSVALLCSASLCCAVLLSALRCLTLQRLLCLALLAVVCTLSMAKVLFGVYELMVETSCSVNLSARMELGLEPLAHPGACAKQKTWTYSTQMGRYVRAQSTFESR